MKVNVYNNLQPKQIQFANSGSKFRLFGGAKGGGKSYALRAEATKQSLSAHNIRGLILRRTFPEVYENAIVPMLSELPLGIYKYNESKGIMKFVNNSTIKFSYCRNLQDVLRYQGLEFDFIGIEELTHWEEREFKILMSCLRTSRQGIKPNFFGSSNPGGIGHAWVKRIWIDRKFTNAEKPENYEFIPAKVWDNQVLMKSQPEYIEDLQNLPEILRRAYLEGDWDVFEGQYFKEFRRDLHVINPMIPMDSVKRIIALDYGYTNPSAVYWMSQDHDGNVIIYRELYCTGLTYEQLAIKIKAMTPQNEKIDKVIVDPAIVNKKSETTGTSGAQEMKKGGLNIKPGNNNRLNGWQCFRKFLHPLEDKNTKEVKTRLKITANCEKLIETLPLQIHDKTRVEDLNTHGEDHAVDAVRYGLMELGVKKSSFAEVKDMNDILSRSHSHKTSLSKPKRDEEYIEDKNILNIRF